MTLVEILVVLGIVAVMAAATVLATGTNEGVKQRAEARRMAALIQFAADRAMIDDVPRAMTLGPGGYRFVEWDEAARTWRPSGDDALAGEHPVPAGATLAADGGGTVIPLGGAASGSGFGIVYGGERGGFRVEFDGAVARVAPAARAPSQ